MQQVDDPPYLTVGTEVSAKYKGAFCEAKVRKVVRNIKCKVAYKQQGLGSGVVSDDQIKGALRVGATVEVKHPERKEYVEATLTKIQDCSQYTVVFDDGDITTLRRSALCLKSGRHFNESETLDQLPLTHPEHFGNPVIGGRRGRRSRHLLPDESSDEEDEPTTHSRSNASDKEENIGKVVCVETSDNKKKNPKENWFPGLVVAPTAQDTVRIRVKDEYLVRSFKDGRYYTVPKKEATEFTRDSVNKSEAAAVSAAIEYMDNDVLPPHWDREALFGTSGSCSDSDQELETDSSDDEPTEEKDHFVAQLYKFMDDRGTPLNKAPSITNRDVDLYRLFRAVQKLHGYNRVTSQNQWKQIALRLGFSPATASITNLVKQAYKKFLFSFEEFNRKLGCTMVPHPKTSRTKGRSLVRASSVQSPKLPEKEKLLTAKEKAASVAAADASAKASSSSAAAAAAAAAAASAAAAAAAAAATEASNSAVEESGNTSESSAAESAVLRPSSTKRKAGGGKVKALVDKFEEKEKERDKEKSVGKGGGGESSGSSGGSKKEESVTPASAKKEKQLGGKAKPAETTVVEKRGRKRKDADSVDSKKDERETTATGGSSASTGGANSNVKQEKHLASSRKEDGGPPNSGSGGGGGGGGSSGNGSGPGSGGGRSISPGSAVSGGTVPDFPIEVGDKLKVYYDEQKVTYEAKVIEIAKQEGNPIYLVHYTGWNTRYDEWVRKERIAENLTNSKTKKGKSSGNTPTAGGPSTKQASSSNAGSTLTAGDKTPKIGKRSRGNSKGEQSSGPGGNSTPRSTTPNVGRNKSPATPSNRRPLTRGGSSAATGSSLSASAAAAGRRTSNNTDISSSLSVPTDPDNTSDTDSDEPMLKKCTTNSTSSTTSSNSSISISSTSTKVSTTAEAGSSSDAAAISDEFSNGASKGVGGGGVGVGVGVGGVGGGRDYDLNQKHFSSSTLTPAQNKLLSKEALSIKSIFESTANRMDEKISDVYEFEDEYDDQDTGSGALGGVGSASGTAGGGATVPRKLVSDVPPAEVVSSLSLTPSSASSTTTDEKRKKPLQRKSMAASSLPDPLDTTGFGTGGYSPATKRAKKPSPMKPEPPAGSENKSPKGAGGLLRRETKEKEDKEQKLPVEAETAAPSAEVHRTTIYSAEALKEKSTVKVAATPTGPPVVTTCSPVGLTTAFVQTPVKSDSTFDVLRKSPSFNLVTPGPLGAKEETFKSQDEIETKPTPPPLPATTTPGIFTPVISASSAGSGGVGDRSISSALYPHGKGPSTSVLLAKAGDDSPKEEPTLENCKKYFNDMNFEFDAPTVKKPPSIADKVLKALSQQQQQQQQQQQAIKSEKPEFPKYMSSVMHHHSLPSTPKSIMNSGLLSSPAMESGTPMSFASAPHPAIKSEAIGSIGGSIATTISSYTSSVTVSAPPSNAGYLSNEVLSSAKSHETSTTLGMKKEPEESHNSIVKSAPISTTDPKTNHPPQTPPSSSSSSSSITTPTPTNTGGGHKLHTLEQIPTSRSNDLTETLRKLDPDPRFAHDDESTDSNDSDNRLIIEDAESQGSGDPVPAVPAAHPPPAALTGSTSAVMPSTTAVIVHYDSKQPVPSSVISAKKELFEERPRSTAASSSSSSSITHEMASAASAAAVAAVADKEKLILKQDRAPTTTTTTTITPDTPSQTKEEPVKPLSGVSSPATTVEKKTSGGAKQSLLETIIQMNTPGRGMSSEEYLMHKVHEQQQQQPSSLQRDAESRKDAAATAQKLHDSGAVPASTSVITSMASGDPVASSTTQSPKQEQHNAQSQAQAPNNESLSLLLCEETIPGSPAPKDQDRLPPSTVGRKVYAEPPLVPTSTSSSSSFLPPQNIQTATDLKPVPMDLEPPVVTITIGGNTTISSTSQSGAAAHDHESLSPVKKRRQRKPSEEPTLKRRRTVNTSLGGYGSANNGSNSGSGYGRSQRGLTTSNATDSEDNSDTIAAFHRSSSSTLIFVGSKTGRPCQYNFLVNLDPSLNSNQRIVIIKKKIQELRKTYNSIKAELASIDRRRKKLRRRERENKKQAKLNSASAGNN
ncbi:AGAP007503-PA [Anopheles gambiae str. PEST]|uniref:AGAP007503-PA n=1 Tax=Anopheles gambiae TaxID=7165 RepID=A7URB8_ANOGA|nr:AGAP007503-PA [Anopheles gambiae str. PEST]